MKSRVASILIWSAFAAFPVLGAGAGAAKNGAPSTYRATANLGPGCRYAVTIVKSEQGGAGGDFNTGMGGLAVNPIPKQWKSHLGALGFAMYCRDKDDPNNPLPSGTYDEVTRTWVKDAPALRKELAKSSDYSDPQFLEKTVATIRTYDVKTPNAQGWADTGDELSGDEEKRRRMMSFCIYRGNKALCGIGNVAYLHDGPKGDLTPQALKIIRSIEFLD